MEPNNTLFTLKTSTLLKEHSILTKRSATDFFTRQINPPDILPLYESFLAGATNLTKESQKCTHIHKTLKAFYNVNFTLKQMSILQTNGNGKKNEVKRTDEVDLNIRVY